MFGDKFSPWQMVVYIRIVANSINYVTVKKTYNTSFVN